METLKRFGPYVAIEVFLPGGTLIALALYFLRKTCRSGATPFDYRR